MKAPLFAIPEPELRCHRRRWGERPAREGNLAPCEGCLNRDTFSDCPPGTEGAAQRVLNPPGTRCARTGIGDPCPSSPCSDFWWPCQSCDASGSSRGWNGGGDGLGGFGWPVVVRSSLGSSCLGHHLSGRAGVLRTVVLLPMLGRNPRFSCSALVLELGVLSMDIVVLSDGSFQHPCFRISVSSAKQAPGFPSHEQLGMGSQGFALL